MGLTPGEGVVERVDESGVLVRLEGGKAVKGPESSFKRI